MQSATPHMGTKSIFQLRSYSPMLSLEQVKNVYRKVGVEPYSRRLLSYSQYGLDGNNVEKYYNYVEVLEDTLYPPYEIYHGYGYHIYEMQKMHHKKDYGNIRNNTVWSGE